MLGLALEGGGAKGAFHMGAVKSLLEEGYTFDAVAGTSIGAFNAAIIAQGDFELGYELWENMTTSLIFDIEDTKLQNLLNKNIDRDTLFYVSAKLKEFVANKGLDTVKIKQLLDSYIDEDKLRASPIDLGMITVSLSDLKPLELYKEDIPEGKITAYLMASANLPVFKLEPIAGKYFLDGGIYDNCPINLLIRKGCTRIIAVRTFGIGISQKPKNTNTTILSILPSEDLGKVLIFDNALIQHNLKLGYYDTKRALYQLKGTKYYIYSTDNMFFLNVLLSLSADTILQISKNLSLQSYTQMQPERLLFEKVLPKLSRLLKLDMCSTYEDLILSLLEPIALESDIERFKIYTLQNFIHELSATPNSLETNLQKKPVLLKVGLVFIQHIAKALAL
ncbi:patatin-like phospholipase family protein [Cellulosilyticum sp. I15G10I2]|uniref:patatin-like phospholipase family protein n=1 Tax=Cellulosilyticum sp. I15G10I2 TaxID=1892843 RepID=UPI00085C8926|nr:patatin-like phospholipase family protein [Cellulosilyticum sp. I15G10I2]